MTHWCAPLVWWWWPSAPPPPPLAGGGSRLAAAARDGGTAGRRPLVQSGCGVPRQAGAKRGHAARYLAVVEGCGMSASMARPPAPGWCGRWRGCHRGGPSPACPCRGHTAVWPPPRPVGQLRRSRRGPAPLPPVRPSPPPHCCGESAVVPPPYSPGVWPVWGAAGGVSPVGFPRPSPLPPPPSSLCRPACMHMPGGRPPPPPPTGVNGAAGLFSGPPTRL